MKYVYRTVAAVALVAFAFTPALAGGDKSKSKTSDTQQLPKASGSVTSDTKVEGQTQGSVTTESPSASPSTTPSTPGATDSTVNPSMKSDPPAGSASPQTGDQKATESEEKKH